MKCPECVESGLKSRVTPGGGVITCLGWFPFYDEDGEYHAHDPNKISQSFHCSNGHAWQTSRVSRCPSQGCPYGKSMNTDG